MSRHAILVLGMHRSGTSALTRMISLLGASLPGELMPEAADNPRGYWESKPIAQFNNRLLQSAGSRWNDDGAIAAEWFSAAERQADGDAALELLEQEFGNAPVVVFKDPRLCRLLPFWQPVLSRSGRELHAVLMLRDPLEVAHSLVAAHPLGLEHALHLWLLYGFAAERASRGYPRMIVEFQQLLEHPQSVLSQALPLVHGTGSLADPARVSAASAFIDPSLHRQRVEPSEGRDPAAAPSLQRVAWIAAQVYAILRDLAMEGSGETEAAVAALTRLEQLWILGGTTLPHQDQSTSAI
jgi:hypothetical protein